jgi:hypothetical protein
METIKKWAKQRIEEHSTWNGLGFILVGLIILLAKPFATIVAYLAIAYGAYSIWKKWP